MGHLSVEIKARLHDAERVRRELQAARARRIGEDHQVDTYFQTAQGRLKLRQGPIENSLIYYERPDTAAIKSSHVRVCETIPDSPLLGLLGDALGVRAVVDKRREIYWVGNVKFHIDRVRGLGEFVEIEAQDHDGQRSEPELAEQCRDYMRRFGVSDTDLIDVSYSDLVGRD